MQMKLKIFISSEMNQGIDQERRQAARMEIAEIGHIPNCFEDLPGRRNPDDKNTRDMCLELVKESDLCVAIIDDTVTDIMDAEIKEAMSCLGGNRVFFYFTQHGKRDRKATDLWNSVKNSWIIKQFEGPDQLTKEISRSIASFAGDVLKGATKAQGKLFDNTISLESGSLWHSKIPLKKRDKITITCSSQDVLHQFKAGFYSREEFFERKSTNIFKGFNLGRQSEKPHFTHSARITKDDDYYFVIRVGLCLMGPARIKTEIKVE